MNKKILSLVSLAGLLALTVSCGGTSESSKASDSPSTATPATATPATVASESTAPETVAPSKEVAYTFTGSATVENVTYEGTLLAYADKTFVLSSTQTTKTFSGTYVFADGLGFTFTFSDTNNTVVNSVYNTETKDHEVTYTMRLGDAGSVEITVKLHDENFTPAEKVSDKVAFLDKAKFTGSITYAENSYDVALTFARDGSYTLTVGTVSGLTKTGTYTYLNNTFTLTETGKTDTFTSTFNVATSTYSLTYTYTLQNTMDIALTYCTQKASFTGSSDRLGGVDLAVYLYGDGTALFDITCATSVSGFDMNKAFDKTATWTVAAHAYTFTFSDETTLSSTYDKTTQVNKLTYTLAGQQATIEFADMVEENTTLGCFSFVGQAGPIYNTMIDLTLRFGESNAVLDVDCDFSTMASAFDKEGTYTFTNNVFTIVIGSDESAQTLTSTFSEEEGTYTLSNYAMQGTDSSFDVTLVASIW